MSGRIHSLLGRAPDRLDALAVSAVATLLALADSWSRLGYRNVVDDALISLRYAQQWVRGNGLVFNTGERVEGYTNFLWTGVLAGDAWLAEAAGWPLIPLASATSALAAAAALVLLYAVARRHFGADPLPVAVALFACVLDNAWSVWAVQALEGPFVACWLLASLLAWQGREGRRGLRLGLALAGLWLTRPDAGLFVAGLLGVTGLDLLWRRRRDGAAPAEAWRDLWRAAAICGGIYALYFAWRFQYYGYPLPNTFYAKLGGGVDGWERGLDYLRRFVMDRAGLPLLALLALARVREPFVALLLLWLVSHAAYVVMVGGDFYPGHRFFVPVMPVIGLLLGVAIDLPRRWPRRRRWALALSGLAVLGGFGLWRGPLRADVLRYRDDRQRNRALMTWLREHSPPEASVFGGDVGSIGFFAQRRALDFYGIIDPFVAHQRVEDLGSGKPGHEKTAPLAYVLRERPDYLKFGLMLVDFYEHGYYLDNGMPLAFRTPGLWRRDRLPERGRFAGDALLTDQSESAAGWRAEGTAFEEFPTRRRDHGPLRLVLGQHGAYASSFSPTLGTGATGRLTSPPIRLSGDRLVFRVAGGHDPQRLRVCLVLGDERPLCTTGYESIALGRREWDIRPYRGRTARLEVVDDSQARNGVILLDEVRQWTAHPGPGPGP